MQRHGAHKAQMFMLTALLSLCTTSTTLAGELAVFSTSDVHGSIMGWDYFQAQPTDVGLAKIYTLLQEKRRSLSKNDASLLIDVGDNLQGTPLDTYLAEHEHAWKRGEHPVFQAFRVMGYDAIVLGNHEFTFGLPYLRKASAQLQGELLAANVIDNKTGKVWDGVRPYVIKKLKVDGRELKVGIIGTVTPAIPNLEAPAHYAGVHFVDQIPVMQHYIKELQTKGVDILIAAVHSGAQRTEQDADENQALAIAKACPELSLLICAHNHVVIDNATGLHASDGIFYKNAIVHGVPIIETGKDGKYLGESLLRLNYVQGEWRVEQVTTEAIPVKGVTDDSKIDALAKPWHEKTLQELSQKIGEATGDFLGAESNHQDSALIDFINNVQREAAGTELSATAALNTSQDLKKGPITLQQIAGLYVYENYLYGIEITGAQLRKYLEHAADFYGTSPDYNYDMVQGVQYTIDLRQPKGHRLTRLIYHGKDVKDSDTFTLAINDYRFHGGNGYMQAMGFDETHPPKIVYDSLKTLGEAGQVRNLIIVYLQKKKSITPIVDNHWEVIGR